MIQSAACLSGCSSSAYLPTYVSIYTLLQLQWKNDACLAIALSPGRPYLCIACLSPIFVWFVVLIPTDSIFARCLMAFCVFIHIWFVCFNWITFWLPVRLKLLFCWCLCVSWMMKRGIACFWWRWCMHTYCQLSHKNVTESTSVKHYPCLLIRAFLGQQ